MPIMYLRAAAWADRKIIIMLRAAPRKLNTEMAIELAVSEATVAARIRALAADGVLRILTQRDFRAAGYEVLASVDVEVCGRSVVEAAKDSFGNEMTDMEIDPVDSLPEDFAAFIKSESIQWARIIKDAQVKPD